MAGVPRPRRNGFSEAGLLELGERCGLVLLNITELGEQPQIVRVRPLPGLVIRLAPQAPTTPDAANLAAVADQLEDLVSTGDPKQTKALLRLLVKDLRVNSRAEILPTYRIVNDTVCALPSSVERIGIEPMTSGLQSRRSPS